MSYRIIYYIYYLITFLATPIIYLLILFRRYRGKEDLHRFIEKFGNVNIHKIENKRLIWIHGASVGECMSAIPMIELLHKQGERVLLTYTTIAAAKIMKWKLDNEINQLFLPFDSPIFIARFLRSIKPDICMIYESEIWPNLINMTSNICPIYLVNARLSERSFKKWQKFPAIITAILNKFSKIFVQSPEDFIKYSNFCQNHELIGNIKFDSPKLQIDYNIAKDLRIIIGERPVFMAASTHNDNEEEELIISAYIAMKKTCPDLFLLFAPRHAVRADEVADLLAHYNIKYQKFSNINKVVNQETESILIDQMGIMGNFYDIADVVLVGGSFCKTEGHNPIEAAHFSCAILSGPYISNFTNIYNMFTANRAAYIVADKDELVSKVIEFVNDKQLLIDAANKALNLVSRNSNISEKIWQIINTKTA